MTFSAFVGIALTLAIVLGLLAITLRVVRRVAIGPAMARAGLHMEVLRRIPLGPRQGIAVVRIGTQTVAVSVGDGGVRQLLVLDPEDLEAVTTAPLVTAGPRDFRALLRDGMRTAGVPIGALLLAIGLATGPFAAHAQQPQRQPNAGPLVIPRGVPSSVAPQATAPAPNAARTAGVASVPGAQSPRTTNPAAVSGVAATEAVLNRAAPQLELTVGGDKEDGGLRLSGAVGVVVMMGLLTLLPTLLLMMTSFTRILIVLHFLKQALGTQSAPPAHLVSALALLLTGFVMGPTLSEANRTAITPWLNGEIEQAAMMSAAVVPFRGFMLRQTRDRDIEAFVEMSEAEPPKSVEEIPTVVLMSAFVTSELRTAFQLGFALFLPFIIIDIVVSAVLMSMGMFMLPPAMISLPVKLLLFVLVDGWSLVIQGLVAGFK